LERVAQNPIAPTIVADQHGVGFDLSSTHCPRAGSKEPPTGGADYENSVTLARNRRSWRFGVVGWQLEDDRGCGGAVMGEPVNLGANVERQLLPRGNDALCGNANDFTVDHREGAAGGKDDFGHETTSCEHERLADSNLKTG
jgi:hypothetical protein